MNKKLISLMAALAMLVAFSACGEDCKTCSSSSTINTYVADTLFNTTTQAGGDQEFCDDQLELVEAGPITAETESSAGGINQRIETITTYNCN